MMNPFKRKKKPTPSITVDGLDVQYLTNAELWQFEFQGVPFMSAGASLQLPSRQQLEAILAEVESLKPEMIKRITKGFAECPEIKMDDGEGFLIELEQFHIDGSYIVTWSDGKTWGDMGVDFTIKNACILDEAWGD